MTELKDPAPDCPEELFEEQFPSLKGSGWSGQDVEENQFMYPKAKWFSRADIQEHCIDKKRAKEVILNHNSTCTKTRNLLKELGLEDV